jgi:hypothetical protein
MNKSKICLIRTQSDALDMWIISNYESNIRNEFDDGPTIDKVKINVFTICPFDKHPQEDFLVRFSSRGEIIFTGINLDYFYGGVCIFDGDLYTEFENQFVELYTHETRIIRAHMYCAYIEKLNDDILFYIRNIILSEYNCNYL